MAKKIIQIAILIILSPWLLLAAICAAVVILPSVALVYAMQIFDN